MLTPPPHPRSPLIRAYLRPARTPVGVTEDGVIFFVRADHIGRPVFATNATGVKTWTATPALAGVLGHIAR